MKRSAFTLLELLIVVGIIVLLIALMVPGLGRARKAARTVLCANNLHQISTAFGLARLPNGGLTRGRDFPGPSEWPTIPMNVVSNARMYRCPESLDVTSSANEYTLYTNIDNMYINFADGVDCQVENLPGGITRYNFDDGLSRDYNDLVIEVTNGSPRVATCTRTYYGAANGILSLCRNQRVVPGWEDFRNVAVGKSFIMGGGGSNYAINAAVGRANVAVGTIVLLDYAQTVANNGEYVPKYLRDSARHSGRLNVLYADGSVTTSWPMALYPTLAPRAWAP